MRNTLTTQRFVLVVILNDLLVYPCFSLTYCPSVELPNGVASLRDGGRAIFFKCNTNFHLVGGKFAVCLKSNEWKQPRPVCVSNKCPQPVVPENVVVKTHYNGSMLTFTCPSRMRLSGPDTILCNGTAWNDQVPTCLAEDSPSLTCNFEGRQLCGWSNDKEDDFDWLFNQGPTPNSRTGPHVDHTTNSSDGYYLFIEASAPVKNGDQARLVSPVYTHEAKTGMCLEVFYHMFDETQSNGVGNLDVYVKTMSGNRSEMIFHQTGNHGDRWIEALLYLPHQNDTFQVIIQATRLDSFLSDIAIDDIRIFPCEYLPSSVQTTESRGGNILESASTPSPSQTPTPSSTTTENTSTDDFTYKNLPFPRKESTVVSRNSISSSQYPSILGDSQNLATEIQDHSTAKSPFPGKESTVVSRNSISSSQNSSILGNSQNLATVIQDDSAAKSPIPTVSLKTSQSLLASQPLVVGDVATDNPSKDPNNSPKTDDMYQIKVFLLLCVFVTGLVISLMMWAWLKSKHEKLNCMHNKFLQRILPKYYIGELPISKIELRT